MSFIDDFTNAGAQQNLSSRSGWSLADGTASDIYVPAAGTELHCAPTTETAVRCTDQGSADHYTEVVWSGNCSGFICIRLTDSQNFIGFRNTGTFWQVYKRVAGTFTSLGTDYSAASSPGDVARMTGSGNTITFTVNGTPRVLGAGVTVTDHNTVTRQGVVARSDNATPWITNWEAASLGGGGTDYPITAAQGSFVLTGQSTNFSAARPITAAQDSFALTGQDVGFISSRNLVAAQGSFTFTGQDVTLTYAAAGSYSIAAGQGSYSLTGSDSYADYAMSAAGGSYALSGQDATLTYFDGGVTTSLTADVGVYALTGRNARLHWSGEPIVPNRQAGIYMGMRIGL